MPSLKSYATLAMLREYNRVDATDTADDGRYLRKLREATAEIDSYTTRYFQPLQETHKFDWVSARSMLFRGQDLLVGTTVTDSVGTVDPTAIIWLGDAETTYGPYYGFELDPGKVAFMYYLTTKTRAISITGIWGYHDDYANAWHDTTLTVQGGGINASVTTITTSANPTTAADAWGQTPAVSAGNLIQVDTEWMHVVATSATTITVVRGANGTTAAAHLTGAAISVYEAPKDIQEVCIQWASWLVKQAETDFGHVFYTPQGIKVPVGLPPSICEKLDTYRKVRVR